MVFKFAYFVEHTRSYQFAELQCFRFTGSSFTEGLQKHNDDVIMTSFHILEFEISAFCETNFNLLACQVSDSSVLNQILQRLV